MKGYHKLCRLAILEISFPSGSAAGAVNLEDANEAF